MVLFFFFFDLLRSILKEFNILFLFLISFEWTHLIYRVCLSLWDLFANILLHICVNIYNWDTEIGLLFGVCVWSFELALLSVFVLVRVPPAKQKPYKACKRDLILGVTWWPMALKRAVKLAQDEPGEPGGWTRGSYWSASPSSTSCWNLNGRKVPVPISSWPQVFNPRDGR